MKVLIFECQVSFSKSMFQLNLVDEFNDETRCFNEGQNVIADIPAPTPCFCYYSCAVLGMPSNVVSLANCVSRSC